MWPHQPGSTPAKNVGNGGAPIRDLQTCDRGDYATFCGYMTADPAKVHNPQAVRVLSLPGVPS